MKRLSSLGIGLLAVSLLTATLRAYAHGDASGGSGGASSNNSNNNRSDTSTHSDASNSGGHSGHDGGASHGALDHGRSNDSRGFVITAGPGAQHAIHSLPWHDSRHREIYSFHPMIASAFHASGSSGSSERNHFPSAFRPADRSRGDSATETRARDLRRDIIFHGYHYRRCNGAWVLITAEVPLFEASFPPEAPYEFTNETDLAGADSTDDIGLPEVIGIAVQTKLTRRGYYHGRIDGIIGPATRDAISAFQKDNGLRVTGYVNTDLVEALKL